MIRENKWTSKHKSFTLCTILWAKGLNAIEIYSEMHQCMATSVLRNQTKKMLGGQKFAYRGAISRLSVDWTAARIILCTGHSEDC